MKNRVFSLSGLKVFLELLLLLLLSQCLWGQTNRMRIAPTPAWVKSLPYGTAAVPPADQISGGAYLESYEEQYNLGKEAAYSKVVRKLMSETGVQNNAQFAISFDPTYQQLLFHQIGLIRSGHLINQLDLSKIRLVKNEQNLERFMYSGLYTAYFNFEDVRVGDKVCFAYTLVGRNPIFDHAFGQDIYFSGQNFIRHLFFRITTAAGQDIHLRYFNDAPKALLTRRENKSTYEWTLNDIPARLPESGTPYWYEGGPHVQVSTFDSWKQVIDWAHANLAVATSHPVAALSKLADALKKKAGDDTLKYIAAATDFVQDQIRYMGIEMGVHSHLPHPPGRVLKQRYGDCKDKSLLLVTLLQRFGIAANIALVNSYNGHQLKAFQPAIVRFNHAIVTFLLEGKRYWIDPTIAAQGGDIVHTATPDYGYALVLDDAEKGLRRMVVHTNDKTDIQETFIIPENNDTDGLLEVISTYTGAEADQVRQQFRYSSKKELQQSYVDYYNRLYMHVSRADTLKIADDPEANVIRVTELYHLGTPWSVLDSSADTRRFVVYARPVSDRLPGVVNDHRQSPVALGNGIDLQYHLQIILPDEHWTIQPSGDDISRTAYHFTYAAKQIADTVKLGYSFQTFQNYIAADSADLLNADLKKIKGDLSYQLTVNDTLRSGSKKASVGAILLGLLCLVIFTYIGMRLYRYSPASLDRPSNEGLAIGGWLILIGIALCLSPLVLTYPLVNGGYWSQSLWLKMQSVSPGLVYATAFEAVAGLFAWVGSILVLVLFFKRRTTFPKAFIFICLLRLVIAVVDCALSASFLSDASPYFGQIFGAIIYSAIWIPYMLNSKRVKATFVYPYAGKLQPVDDPPLAGGGISEEGEQWGSEA